VLESIQNGYFYAQVLSKCKMEKPSILLLHGALGSKVQMEPIKKLLMEEFDVHAFNFSGHGGDESNEAFSIDLFTQNVIDFMSANNLPCVSIFGYSMGGYVALNLALRQPDLVDRIVTYGTKFDWTETSAAREVKMLNPEKIEEKVPKFAEKLKNDHFPSDWKRVMNKTAQMMLNLGSGAKISEAEFAQVIHDVTIAIGLDDTMVTVHESEQISSLIPNARLEKLLGQPHPFERVDMEIIKELIGSMKS
jgi:pimeloyl-ACP methyl ester carboxylesterase